MALNLAGLSLNRFGYKRLMYKSLINLLFFFYSSLSLAQTPELCSTWSLWSKPICNYLGKIWTEGSNDLYIPGYAWHNRYTYSKHRIATTHYNELALGGGLGKGLYDEKGNWQGIYAFAFLDSHKNVEPIAGYGFLKTAELRNTLRLGIGYTIFITARPDIWHNIPFPGALPLITLGYRRVTFAATYIPGAKNVGNVLFLFSKWVL